MVLMRGVQCGTLYRLLGITSLMGIINTTVPESKYEESQVLDVFGGDTMLSNTGTYWRELS